MTVRVSLTGHINFCTRDSKYRDCQLVTVALKYHLNTIVRDPGSNYTEDGDIIPR